MKYAYPQIVAVFLAMVLTFQPNTTSGIENPGEQQEKSTGGQLALREDLSNAIWEGKSQLVKEILPKIADLDNSIGGMRPPIFEAVSAGEETIVRMLVEAGAGVNVREPEWKMPLLNEAAALGDEKILDYLLSKGAKLNGVDKFGGNALEEAAFNGHRQLARRLLSLGLKTKFRLHIAAGIGTQKELERELSKKNIDTDEATGWKNTPLFFAVANRSVNAVQMLLEQGANPNVKNVFGCTPLHYAASLENADAITALIKAGASRNVKNLSDETPEDWTNNAKIIKLLQQAKR